MRNRITTLTALLLSIAVFAAGCSLSLGDRESTASSSTLPPPPVDTSSPSVAEGIDASETTTIDLGDGARLIIPPGAIKDGAEVSADYGEPPSDEFGELQPIAHPVELTTEPKDAIQGVLTLEFPVDPDHVDSAVGISTFDEGSQQWTPVQSTYDAARGLVVAQIEHFSWWNPFTWDFASIGAGINQRIGEIVGKRAPAARCERGEPVPGWVAQVVGVSNDSALAVRGCTEGEGDLLVVELVNNRPYSMYLEYGSAVAWGWHESGESGIDFARNKLGDAWAGSDRLYLPPRGRAAVGIVKTDRHATFSAGYSMRALSVDVLTSVIGEVVDRIPGVDECMAGLFATPIGEFGIGRVRDGSAELFGCVQNQAAGLGYFDDDTIEQLGAYSKAVTKVGGLLTFGDYFWNVTDLFVDEVVVSDTGMGAGFSVRGKSSPTGPSDAGGSPGAGAAPSSPNATTVPAQLGTTSPPNATSPGSSTAPGGSRSGPKKIVLSRGGSAPHGSWYSVKLSGFAPGSRVSVKCRDSVDPQGFWTQVFVIDGSGRASDSTLCYSADGPDHWVTGGGVESNHVRWSGGSSRPTPPPAPAPSPKIALSRGGSAPHGSWYSVKLSGFAPGSRVSVKCRDSVDPQGFWTQVFVIDGSGRASDSTLCYSADGPDHWVTGAGVESNHVRW